MWPRPVTRIFSGNSSSLGTALKRFVLCRHIIKFTHFFQMTKHSKTLTFFVSYGCERKPLYPKVAENFPKDAHVS